jgi:hypothetical protein
VSRESNGRELKQTSIDEKAKHWKLTSCTVSIEGARGNKASLCGFKEDSQSGVLGHLKTKSMTYMISKKTAEA